MALENQRVAWVNRSSTNIPVYSTLVSSPAHTGGHTVGGTQVGTIYPNEFYTLVPNDSFYITSFLIIFRNGSGSQTTGYIETSPGYTLDNYGWVAYQEPYHYYNSNGSSLIASTSETIGGTSYRTFTVNKAVTYRNPSGVSQGTLAVGTKLATIASTAGQTYGGYMVFYKKKASGGSWQDLVSDGYGFVDLGLSQGSVPSDRAIR
ncbi:hypothetical protein FACS1894105_10780 [Clostridia bacterium]|nr:hypothetical protein FACS1894105_10780 [Clostridia bacterium]